MKWGMEWLGEAGGSCREAGSGKGTDASGSSGAVVRARGAPIPNLWAPPPRQYDRTGGNGSWACGSPPETAGCANPLTRARKCERLLHGAVQRA